MRRRPHSVEPLYSVLNSNITVTGCECGDKVASVFKCWPHRQEDDRHPQLPERSQEPLIVCHDWTDRIHEVGACGRVALNEEPG
jgi:hypothetical protein